MSRTMYWLSLFLTVTAAAQPSNGIDLDVPNANHIFNAIHDSMRQFGSSLNHNGMSVFFATVPMDTELYHGTFRERRINGTEWVAFEPEHALIFARGRPQKEGSGAGSGFDDSTFDSQTDRLQMVIGDGAHARVEWPPEPKGPGYLHTYRTKHELRLLYVDGQSAAKSDKGTLDTQDYVLLPEPPSSAPGEWLPFEDYARAQSLCRTARTEWHGRIDGVVRMEAGFEIILCDFEKDLDVVKIARVNGSGARQVGEVGNEMLNYYKAVAARYDGIGGGRVKLNYDNFVTLFDNVDAMYLDDTALPRIDNTSAAIPRIRKDVEQLTRNVHSSSSTNWQAITDLIVARYADRITYLTSGNFANVSKFQIEVDRALLPFIDYNSRDSTAEIERCVNQFLPASSDGSVLAFRAILNVTTTLCSSLRAVLSDDIELEAGIDRITRLKDWLQWTEWKKCRGCGYHEVCFLPIWPLGRKEDFKQPKCRSDLRAVGGGYWWDDRSPRKATIEEAMVWAHI